MLSGKYPWVFFNVLISLKTSFSFPPKFGWSVVCLDPNLLPQMSVGYLYALQLFLNSIFRFSGLSSQSKQRQALDLALQVASHKLE